MLPQEVDAQRNRKSKKQDQAAPPKGKTDKDAIKSIDEVAKNADAIEGLFTLYVDSTSGSSWMAIPDSMLEREFIYFSVIEDGVA